MTKKNDEIQEVLKNISTQLENISNQLYNANILNDSNFQRIMYKCSNMKIYTGGQRWELALEERFKNKLYLDGFGYKVYSQCDEDGIINEIFNRIGTTNKKFIEIGVQDGTECNTRLLLETGWNGSWIEGNQYYEQQIRNVFKKQFDENKLQLLNAFITKDNINAIFENNGMSGDIDFFSLDIDGNDWYVMKSVLEQKVINPRVICLEYNALIPPSEDPDDYSTDFKIDYKEDWVWGMDGSDIDYYGASLSSFYHLLKDFDYQLVGTCISGVNAFFVKKELVKNKFQPELKGAGTYYNPSRMLYKYLIPGHKGYGHLQACASGL